MAFLSSLQTVTTVSSSRSSSAAISTPTSHTPLPLLSTHHNAADSLLDLSLRLRGSHLHGDCLCRRCEPSYQADQRRSPSSQPWPSGPSQEGPDPRTRFVASSCFIDPCSILTSILFIVAARQAAASAGTTQGRAEIVLADGTVLGHLSADDPSQVNTDSTTKRRRRASSGDVVLKFVEGTVNGSLLAQVCFYVRLVAISPTDPNSSSCRMPTTPHRTSVRLTLNLLGTPCLSDHIKLILLTIHQQLNSIHKRCGG